MLAPYWIENTGSSWPNVFDTEYATHIHLPLHKEALMNFAKLQENLKKVFDPNLLLFLKQLSIMILEDYAYAGQKSSFFRLERTNLTQTKNWIMCSSQQQNYEMKSNIWYVKRTQFQPTVPRKDELDIAETEIAIAVHFEEEADEALQLLNDLDTNAEEDDFDIAAINKKLQKASNKKFSNKPRLMLSLPSTLYPVYAFLPTRMTVCKFIIQADFILVTNRESIEEQHAYNRQLLEQIQQLIVELFQELVAYCESVMLHSQTSAGQFAGLLEIIERNKLDVAPSAIVQLLPKPSNTISNVFKELNTSICTQLSSTTRLFLSSAGKFVHASEILYTHHLSPDTCPIEQLLPDSLLFSLSKKYYLDSSIQLDEEMLDLFQISKATSSFVVDCIVAFAATIPDSIPTGTLESAKVFDQTLKKLSGLWILLHRLFESETVSASILQSKSQSTQVSGPTPTQVRRKAPPPSKRARTLSPENVKKLQQIAIWPVHTMNGIKFLSCDNNILFLPPAAAPSSNSKKPNFDNSSVRLANCLKFFRDKMNMIDDTFLTNIEEVLSSCNFNHRYVNSLAVSPITHLIDFVKQHFGASIVSHEPNVIFEKIVKPTLQNAERKGSSIRSIDSIQPRVCCVMIAYAFIVVKGDNRLQNLFETCCWLPSVIIGEPNENQKGFRWLEDSDTVSLQSLKHNEVGNNTIEVHMGVEIEDSGVKILINNLTALRQCKYRILHPLSTFLAFNANQLPDNIDDRKLRAQISDFIYSNMGDPRYKTELSQWMMFLEKLNVIKFFTIYKNPSTSKYGSETLQSFFSELFKNAEPVDIQESIVLDGLSLYLPNRQSDYKIIKVSYFVFSAISVRVLLSF
jgi:hypothetical protein